MSRYQIAQEEAHGTTAYRLTDTARRAEAVLYPAFGNNCVEFRTTPDGEGQGGENDLTEPVDVFLPPDNVEDLAHSPFHGGQPILFPFPNRVRDGVYTFENNTYRMERLLATGWDRGAGQAIHGLVADKAWTVVNAHADDDGAVVKAHLQLDADPEIFEQYPFPCRITVTYRLREGVLEMQTDVENMGKQTMPMGYGIHPWFPTTLRPGNRMPNGLKEITPEERGAAEVHVPAAAIWELEHLMPTGRVAPVSEDAEMFDLREFRPLERRYYDHVFAQVVYREDGWSEGGLRDPATGLEMYLAADGKFREWVLYAPEKQPVIALEPYTCTTDAVNLEARGIDAGLIALPAGETWTGHIHFGLRRFA
ncbi:MAG: galactose mutarotase-like enzyme [Chthonomonadales bacterium]|nr:galactose mutarotase-like enzyme [Chthonomonadales bacterium]